MKPAPQIASGRQTGVTLVEILIALVLGLLLLGGIIQIFLSSKQISRTQEALSEVQENGRYALEIVSRDLRLAGFKGGCRFDTPVRSLLNPAGMGGGDNPDLFNLNEAVRGWDGVAGPGGPGPAAAAGGMTGYVANTDAVLIKHAGIRTDAIPSGDTAQNAVQVDLVAASGIPQGAIVVVADAENCDQFQNSDGPVAGSVSRVAATGSAPGNLDPAANNLSKTYDDNLVISRFRSAVYYVGAGAFAGQPSALRRVLFDRGTTSQDEEIAQGLVDMQIVYGVDTDGNGAANQYIAASAVGDWDQVVAIRANLLFASTENNVVQAPMTLAFNGGVFNAPDRRMYQVFSTTVQVRNSRP